MSRRSLRTLFVAALALGAALVPAVPAHAQAGPRSRDAGPSLLALVPRWLITLWDSVTADPATSGPADPATGTGTTSTPGGTGNGDVGLQADPNG